MSNQGRLPSARSLPLLSSLITHSLVTHYSLLSAVRRPDQAQRIGSSLARNSRAEGESRTTLTCEPALHEPPARLAGSGPGTAPPQKLEAASTVRGCEE